jgi:hypothetical protein
MYIGEFMSWEFDFKYPVFNSDKGDILDTPLG